MNIVQLQDNLKNLSDQQLTQAMQMPSQDTPPFLVVSELNRRKKMRDSFQAQQAAQDQTTVAQDVVAAAGVPQEGASQMAQSLAPQTDMANNTGIMSIPQGGEPQRMAGGGVVKMFEGQTVPAMSYADFIAAIQAGNRPTEEQYMASVESLTDQQAADIRSMLDDPSYVPEDWEQNAANAPGVTPTTPAPPMPSAAWDWAAGVFGGRTLGEQQAIDAQRAAALAEATPDASPLARPGQTAAATAAAQAKAAAKKAAEEKAAQDAAANKGGGGGGGGGGSSKPSDYEQAIMDALAGADKKAKQDKWMTLAQMGLSLMSSQQPNFFAAVGEAGTNAIPAFQKARDTATDEKLALNKGLYDIAMQRQARNDALAAAAAKQQAGGGFGISAGAARSIGLLEQQVTFAAKKLEDMGLTPGVDVTDPALGLSPEAQRKAQAAITEYNTAYRTYNSVANMANGIAGVGGDMAEDPTAEVDVAE
jgi:hypothetical protein